MAVVEPLHGLSLAAAWFARVEPPHPEDEALRATARITMAWGLDAA